MKNINLYICLLLAFCVVSCTTEYDVADNFDLEELPGYVAFDADGNNATLGDLSVGEDAGSTTLRIENPTGSFSDIVVNYTLGGSAVFGVDYSIDGASASGGSITIGRAPTDFSTSNFADIAITINDNMDVDGERNIVVTLVSASNADGDVAVGRGGTDFLKEATIPILDND